MKRVRAGLAAAAVVVLVGCGDDDDPVRACTEVACGSRVTVILQEPPPERTRVRVCVGSTCRTVRAAQGRVEVPLEGQVAGGDVRVSVAVLGERAARDAADLELERVEPNGPNCPPVCFTGTIFYDARRDQLLPAGS